MSEGIIIDNDLEAKPKHKVVSVDSLNGAENVPFAVAYHPDTGQRCYVMNTANIGELWDILHDLEDMIKSVKIQIIKRQQMTGIQTAPASVLDKLRG